MAKEQLYHFLILLIPAVLAKIVLNRAQQRLDQEKRLELFAAVERINKVRSIAFFILVTTLVLLPQASFVLLPLFLFGLSWLYWQRIAPIELPTEYIQAFRVSIALGAIAIGLFLFFSGRNF